MSSEEDTDFEDFEDISDSFNEDEDDEEELLKSRKLKSNSKFTTPSKKKTSRKAVQSKLDESVDFLSPISDHQHKFGLSSEDSDDDDSILTPSIKKKSPQKQIRSNSSKKDVFIVSDDDEKQSSIQSLKKPTKRVNIKSENTTISEAESTNDTKQPNILPLTLSKPTSSCIVELVDSTIDLSGDSGIIGKFESKSNENIVFDIKGHKYSGNCYPIYSCMIVNNVSNKSMKIETITNKIIKLKHTENELTNIAGVMVEGDNDNVSDYCSDDSDAQKGCSNTTNASLKRKRTANGKKKGDTSKIENEEEEDEDKPKKKTPRKASTAKKAAPKRAAPKKNEKKK